MARIALTGRITFALHCRFPGSPHPTRRKLGQYPMLSIREARSKARLWLMELEEGRDPSRTTPTESTPTFAEVLAEFEQTALSKQRKGSVVARQLHREFVPVLGTKPVASITPADITAIVRDKVKAGKLGEARNMLGSVRRLYSWALSQHAFGLEHSPCERIRAIDIVGPHAFRQRSLTDPEIAAYWKAAEEIGFPYGPLFQLLLATSTRRSEAASMEWPDVDLAKRLWTIPPTKMKSNATHLVPLSDLAFGILNALPRHVGGGFVFSFKGTRPVTAFSRPVADLERRMAEMLGSPVPPFVLHDTRRTVRTNLSALRVPDVVAERCLGHRPTGLTRVYDLHQFLDERREAMEQWAHRIEEIVTREPTR